MNGLKEGFGIIFNQGNKQYEGEFKKDLKEGKGLYYFENGEKYDG